MPVAFGVNSQRQDLQASSVSGTSLASYNNGFPPITMISKDSGGVPPQGKDFNQILYELSSDSKWSQASGIYPYNSDFCTSIGGYPKGALVIGSDGISVMQSQVDDNTDSITSDSWSSITSPSINNISSSYGDIYLGCFFDSRHSNRCFLTTSEDGYNWSNPTYIKYNGDFLTLRDPTLIFYKGKFVLLEGGTVDVADCYLYISDDLNNWVRYPIVFNSDGANTVFSNTRVWSNGGGTVACSKSWAQEPCVDADGNLYIMSSFYVGIDSTNGSTTDNMFKVGISKCLNWDTLEFDYPTAMQLYTDASTKDVYSRIDPSLTYSSDVGAYILAVKRENYGFVDIFKSSTIDGDFVMSSSIKPSSDSTAENTQFEGPSIFNLRDGGVGVSVDDYYGATGQWLSISTDGVTFSDPESMRLSFARHGSIRYYSELPAYADYYILRSQVQGSTIKQENESPKFIHYQQSRSIIPVADAIYWTSDSGLSLSIEIQDEYPAKRFYVLLNTSSTSAYTTISGAITGGDCVVGYGVNNYILVEFVYNINDSKYVASSRYSSTNSYTTGVSQSNNVRSLTGLDLGYGNSTASSRQITGYPYGTTSPSGNINFGSTTLSIYSSTTLTMKASTYVDVVGYGVKFPSRAVGSLPAASSYQNVELMCTGMTYATDGTTAISPTTQKVYSDGTNWRLISSPSTIIA